MLQLFEYSKGLLQLGRSIRSCRVFNGLDDLKVAVYVCPNHTDHDIYSDPNYLDTLGIPLNFTFKKTLKREQLQFVHLYATHLGCCTIVILRDRFFNADHLGL